MSKKQKLLHEGHAINKDFTLMTIPLFIMATFLYGPRVLLMVVVAIIAAKVVDHLVAALRKKTYDKTENSSVTIALIIILMLPANLAFRFEIVAVVAAILIGKEAFGGYGNFPFNPAAVGLCIVGVCWPQYVFRYPQPFNWLELADWRFSNVWKMWSLSGATMTEGASGVLRNGGLPQLDFWNMILGNYAAPLGISSILIIVSCAVYLIMRKRISLHAPIAFLVTLAAIFFVFPRVPENAWQMPFSVSIGTRLEAMKFEMFSSTAIFSAIFLITEPCTLPRNKLSQVIYGAIIGIATVLFRYFGAYDLNVCFALLIVNAISGYFDRAVANRMARRNSKKAMKRKSKKGVATT